MSDGSLRCMGGTSATRHGRRRPGTAARLGRPGGSDSRAGSPIGRLVAQPLQALALAAAVGREDALRRGSATC